MNVRNCGRENSRRKQRVRPSLQREPGMSPLPDPLIIIYLSRLLSFPLRRLSTSPPWHSGLRHLIEYCFSKLEQFHGVATRHEKTARNYLAVVTIAAIVLWIR